MSALPDNGFEARLYPRIAIDGRIQYKLPQDPQFDEGMIIDVSQNGMLIGMDRELAIDTRILILMASDNEQEPPIEISADIIRIAPPVGGYEYSYGCVIVEVKDL